MKLIINHDSSWTIVITFIKTSSLIIVVIHDGYLCLMMMNGAWNWLTVGDCPVVVKQSSQDGSDEPRLDLADELLSRLAMWKVLACFGKAGDYPDDPDCPMEVEPIAALKHGSKIFVDIDFEDALRNISRPGYDCDLFSAVKMEKNKPSYSRRMTANPQRLGKWFISTHERNLRFDKRLYPPMLQGRSDSEKWAAWEAMGLKLTSNKSITNRCKSLNGLTNTRAIIVNDNDQQYR